MKKSGYESMESVLGSLEKISNQFAKDAEEYQAIELSAHAMLFILTVNHLSDFKRYLYSMKSHYHLCKRNSYVN
jgi:hypothetical protein